MQIRKVKTDVPGILCLLECGLTCVGIVTGSVRLSSVTRLARAKKLGFVGMDAPENLIFVET